jgi:hypothetical protein
MTNPTPPDASRSDDQKTRHHPAPPLLGRLLYPVHRLPEQVGRGVDVDHEVDLLHERDQPDSVAPAAGGPRVRMLPFEKNGR